MELSDLEQSTIACVDVFYADETARAACVVIANWDDARPANERVVELSRVEDYQPGEFYRRELPCIQAVLAKLERTPDCIVVDGYVWLDAEMKPGLGAHLYNAMGRDVPVIGVAKNPFGGTKHAGELHRGQSARPLYITAAGLTLDQAMHKIEAMHGAYRMPTILKRVDELSRDGVFAGRQRQ